MPTPDPSVAPTLPPGPMPSAAPVPGLAEPLWPHPQPDLLWLYGVELLVVLAATWGAVAALNRYAERERERAGRAGGEGRWWGRWAPLLRVALWTLGGALGGAVVAQAVGAELWWLGAPLALGAGLAGRELLRELLAGVVLALDRPFDVGDVIRVQGHEGEVRAVGLRSVRLATSAGHLLDIPNHAFLHSPTSNITPEESDLPTRIEMTLPAEAPVARVREIAYLAAAVSRYASPRRTPEVFLDAFFDQKPLLRMTILGYVFDPAYEARFRSDVVEHVRARLDHDARPAPEDALGPPRDLNLDDDEAAPP